MLQVVLAASEKLIILEWDIFTFLDNEVKSS